MKKTRGNQGTRDGSGGADRRHHPPSPEKGAQDIPGDEVDLTDELLADRKRDAALAAAQEYFCKLAPPERVLSEELLRERREEAKHE